MTFSISLYNISIICYVSILLYISYKIFKKFVLPWIVDKQTTEIEKNPKWIKSKIHKYYGVHDIDIIVVTSPLGMVPRFKLSKDKKLQLLIPEDTSTKDVEDVAQLALAGKIRIKYGLWFPEKSAAWLSILCYLLDGCNLSEDDITFNDNKDK